MAADAQSITWTFGGALAGQPPTLAWTVLGVGAIVGVAWVAWSYHRALVEATPSRRISLGVLRSLVWLGLLGILAGPTRVTRTYDEPGGPRPLAVLIDRSASMTTPDNRQRRRLDDALRRWRELAPAARRAHRKIETFAFADDVQPASLGELTAEVSPEQTKLFVALQRVLDAAPEGGWAGVVTLTDGLDTSGTTPAEGVEATVRAALRQSTALFFVPGRNRYSGEPFSGLRDFNVPAHSAPHSTFRVDATFDSFQVKARTMDVQITVNGVTRPPTALRLGAGRRLTAWSAEVEALEAGEIDVELRAGDERARATVRVAHPAAHHVLYFQGALDWSYRFLADILQDERSLALTPVLLLPNPEAVLPPGALPRMPEIPKELEGYDMVILANASAAQFTTAQQTALSAWVRDGGVVLFFTPDDDSTQGFIGSELEKMLPVLFASPPGHHPQRANRVLGTMGGGSGANDPTKLLSFAWEDSPRVREIFAEAEPAHVALVSPQFSEYAHVARAKPGADVLARHPTDLAPDGQERAILLAVQRYGRGQSGVLTTDALWRWKLNQPADDSSAGRFWQTLFSWLTRERQRGLHFEEAPWSVPVDREISLRILGATTEKLHVEALLDDQRIGLDEASRDGDTRVHPWRPTAEGLWLITARDDGGRTVKHWVTVRKAANVGERSGAAPDEALLRDLAARSGGAVLEASPPPAWQEPPRQAGALLGERHEPLWHRGWIFVFILGLYAAELILRRKWRML